MEKEKTTSIIVIILCVIAIAVFGFGKYFAIFEPLDDYAIYDDFTDVGYQVSSSLETIQIGAGETKTINLPENTKLVIAYYYSLPDYGPHTFYVNGNPMSLQKIYKTTNWNYLPSAILFDLSDYPNRKIDFGENTIQNTNLPLTVWVQTGNCNHYKSFSTYCIKIFLPNGINPTSVLCGSCLYLSDSNRLDRIHQNCYYPKWEGRKVEQLGYALEGGNINPYGSTYNPPADFTPSLGKIEMYNDVSVKDFKNSDIKIKYYSNIKIDIVSTIDNVFYKGIENSVSLPALQSTAQDHIVGILHSKITPGELHIYNDGIYIGNITANFNNYHLRITTLPLTGNVDYVKYKIPFNCKSFEDEHLVYEDYLAGQTIRLDDNFRLNSGGCEVRKFCLGHPTVLSSASGTNIDYENEVYQKMVSGESLTVPQTENWKLIFIAKLSDTGNCKEYIPKPVEIVKGYCTVDEDCPVSPCTGFYYRCEDNQCKGYGQCIVPPQPKLFWQKLGAIWNSFVVWLSGLWI